MSRAKKTKIPKVNSEPMFTKEREFPKIQSEDIVKSVRMFIEKEFRTACDITISPEVTTSYDGTLIPMCYSVDIKFHIEVWKNAQH